MLYYFYISLCTLYIYTEHFISHIVSCILNLVIWFLKIPSSKFLLHLNAVFYLHFILNHIAVLVNYKGTWDRYSLLRSIISIGITRQSVAYKALSARLFAFLLLVCETHFREYGKGITSEKYQTINGRQERIERDVHATTDIYVRLQPGEMVKHEDMESKYRGSAWSYSRRGELALIN